MRILHHENCFLFHLHTPLVAPGVYSSSGKSSIKFRDPQNISDDLPTLKGAIALTLKIQDISDLFSY